MEPFMLFTEGEVAQLEKYLAAMQHELKTCEAMMEALSRFIGAKLERAE